MSRNHAQWTASGQLRRLGQRLAEREQATSLGEMIDGLGQTGLGMTLLVLTLPALIPIPGPFGMVFGTMIAFVSVQVMFGARRLWLPDLLRRRRLTAASVKTIVDKAVPLLEKVEVWLKPRRLLPLTGRLAQMALAIPLFVMAVTLALPVPLGNVPPAASLIMFSLALMLRDGVAVIVGLVLAVLAVLWMTLLIVSGAEILDWLWGLIGWV
jgi:hypothetical protein